MKARHSLAFIVAALLASAASAQRSGRQPQPITTPVRDAGTYHLSTGTWTRASSSALLASGPIVYDNTCTVGFYAGFPGNTTIVDSGRIPSPTSPSGNGSLTGLDSSYNAWAFTIGYCSMQPLVTSIDVGFVDCYAACDNSGTLPIPLVVFNLINVPAAPASAGIGCWIVNVSLANTSMGFSLGGDCTGVYDGVPSTDSFGWSWTEVGVTSSLTGGPLFAGDPSGFFPQSGQTCGGIGASTSFAGAGSGPGTGIGLLDQVELGGSAVAVPGCYWFGGYTATNPLASFYMSLEAFTEGPFCPGSLGAPFCFGDGSGANCPCGNDGAVQSGCANSGGTGVNLSAQGCGTFSVDTLHFSVAGVAGSKPGLLLRGNNTLGGGAGNPIGDGLICTAGQSARSQVQVTNAGGATVFHDWNGAGFGSVAAMGAETYFQFWYRDPQGSPCGSGFNFSNGWRVSYLP